MHTTGHDLDAAALRVAHARIDELEDLVRRIGHERERLWRAAVVAMHTSSSVKLTEASLVQLRAAVYGGRTPLVGGRPSPEAIEAATVEIQTLADLTADGAVLRAAAVLLLEARNEVADLRRELVGAECELDSFRIALTLAQGGEVSA